MLINLEQSKLFSVDPAQRFALIYKVNKRVWNEIWRRYSQLGYDNDGLCGYLLYKTGIRFEKETMDRWLFRSIIYSRAQLVMAMGVRAVQSEYFGELEDEIIKELTHSLKYGAAKDSRTIV